MHDINGTVTTDPTLYAETVYTITVHKLLSTQTAVAMQAIKKDSKSNILFEMPDAVQLSSMPLRGNVFIRCVLPDQTFVDTREFPFDAQ